MTWTNISKKLPDIKWSLTILTKNNLWTFQKMMTSFKKYKFSTLSLLEKAISKNVILKDCNYKNTKIS